MQEILSLLRFIGTLLFSYSRRTVLVVVCLFVASVFEGVSLAAFLPLFALVTGEKGGGQDELGVGNFLISLGIGSSLGGLILLIISLFIVKAGIVWMAKRQVGFVTAQIGADLRHELISAITSVRWPYYVTKPVGSLANALSMEAEQASNAYFQSARFVADFFTVSIYAILAAFIAWEASVASLLVGVVCIVLLQRFVRMGRDAGMAQVELLKSTAGKLVDRLASFKAMKAMNQESVLSTVLAAETDQLNFAKQKEVNAKEGLQGLQELFFVVAVAGSFYIAVEFLNIELSRLMVLGVLFFRSLNRFGTLQVSLQGIARCESAYRSIRHAIDVAESQKENFQGRCESGFYEEHCIYKSQVWIWG